jgi:hypothetical protein
MECCAFHKSVRVFVMAIDCDVKSGVYHMQSGTFSFDLFDADDSHPLDASETDDDIEMDMDESSTDDDMAISTVGRSAFTSSGGTYIGMLVIHLYMGSVFQVV